MTPNTRCPAGWQPTQDGAVFDGPDYAQQPPAPAIGEDARAVGPVQLHQRRTLGMASVTGFGAFVDHPVDLGGVGGEGDAAFFIEDAYAANARLAAQFLDDVIERLAIVAQHLVMRAALDDVGDALGR